ncbi:glycosyltransferase family 4 protein [Flavobacterium sp.]|jgi:glycosyltransferase involved in cell wall biosynthesis|uniref:glycosyltransferase family 4 protein n=1 Tax=Flavobacterium sp. TaxID=239 RepID=UPI0022C5B9A2|nr:glycosyltransferase family 4 protein [Flavobacterium sp.]MCZ8169811.1 glycosyltransferase family 4 protein [Flavobacterium sp.]
MKKLIRITTVPLSLDKLLEGQLRYMASHYEVVAVSSEAAYLKRVAEREGVRYHPVTMTRKITPFHDVKAVYQLYRFFRNEKPFIVHTHTPKAGLVGMLAARLAGVPHRLHTVAGLPLLEARGIKRLILNAVERLTGFCATKVYPNSKALCHIMVQERLAPVQKLNVIGAGSSNGIATAYFSKHHFSSESLAALRETLGLSPAFVFVFVGRLVADKGIHELVAAFEALHKKGIACQLLLVGPFESELDPLQASTLEVIEQHPHIFTTGYQNDVRPYFALADALVFPSYREGFPNVVLQAGAMALPSIVSDINGCNEIIEHGVNGLIVPVKTVQPLFDAMYTMVTDVDLRHQMQAKARSLITQRYEQQVIWEAILEEYRTFERNA